MLLLPTVEPVLKDQLVTLELLELVTLVIRAQPDHKETKALQVTLDSKAFQDR
tara:strand:- start:377 stop:535 length:159 start_codon:yes stop_codon:yes gene_type:complete